MRPLSGRTVLVTRPRPQARELLKRLRRLGARVVPVPLIRTRPPLSWKPLDAALRDFGGFDAAVFTSANGVESFFERARRVLGRAPAAPRKVYAVGPATAKALVRRGWRVAGVPEEHEGGALARHLGGVRGLKILLPRAQAAREELPTRLREAGAEVRDVPVYRTEPDPAGRRELRRLRDADWVTFTSASTVSAFFGALGESPARRFLSRARAAAIGPLTADALRARGVEPAAQARPYTAEGLASALADAQDMKPTLVRALREAGAVLRERYGKVHVRYKGRANLVTEADHASEQRLLDVILSRYPDHDFLTEEREPRSTGSDFVWVADPLDGTTNYAHGFPAFCVSIGLLHRGRPLLAGVFDPCRDELFLAERGRGATLNGKPLRVSRTRRLDESLLLTGFAYDRAARADYLIRFYKEFMRRCHDVRRSGSAARDLAWTAAGRVDGYWEFSLKPWDVAAGWLLVSEAGGTVTDFSGKDWHDLERLGRETLASNGLVHGQMLRLIRRYL